MDRSYLFAPGHNEKLLSKVFDAGADAVMLDLEDAVPIDHKDTARRLVAEVLVDHPAWVRVNAAGTDLCAADLETVGAVAHGIRIPKTESPDDVRWVAERAPGKPIICAIESARGVLAARPASSGPSTACTRNSTMRPAYRSKPSLRCRWASLASQRSIPAS
jgi:citrate lyase subunit beta/citryl-CoA lyase